MTSQKTILQSVSQCDYPFNYREYVTNIIYEILFTSKSASFSKVLKQGKNIIVIRYNVPTTFRSKSFDIPILIYIPSGMPYEPPEMYLDKAHDTGVNPKNTDIDGQTQRIHTYNLKNWKSSFNIQSILNEIIASFNKNFPIYKINSSSKDMTGNKTISTVTTNTTNFSSPTTTFQNPTTNFTNNPIVNNNPPNSYSNVINNVTNGNYMHNMPTNINQQLNNYGGGLNNNLFTSSNSAPSIGNLNALTGIYGGQMGMSTTYTSPYNNYNQGISTNNNQFNGTNYGMFGNKNSNLNTVNTMNTSITSLNPGLQAMSMIQSMNMGGISNQDQKQEEAIKGILIKELRSQLEAKLKENIKRLNQQEEKFNNFKGQFNTQIDKYQKAMSKKDETIAFFGNIVRELQLEINKVQSYISDAQDRMLNSSNVMDFVKVKDEHIIRVLCIEATIEDILAVGKKGFEKGVFNFGEIVRFIRTLTREAMKIKVYREKLVREKQG